MTSECLRRSGEDRSGVILFGGRTRVPSTSQVVDLVVIFLLFPESQVLLEELDDALGVTEVILLELIDLVQSGLQGGVCELTGLGVVLQHLVVEDAEV